MKKDDVYEIEQNNILIKLLKEIGLKPDKLSIERSDLKKVKYKKDYFKKI